ncbi:MULTISPECIES: DUF6249 domain-containing protein [Flavobacterium]|uniref:DUF6249 domain-containing protein n=1 Tax=Flavobacterium resistens TaxID=443612 RepID=A0A521C3D0_9FLAO|nr:MULTISPECIES: DUF6249 domain-containing protein [Flavobacterium]MRX69614.1 hypothetical protein [Flavobacterium resistens]SMO53987.1 hypothetical protein SAMN06265349_102168 [Flavobacterium resistens]
MGPQVLVPLSLFAMIFGIVYLFYSTRNRERLALIEKGADASIFLKGKTNGVPAWKIFILNSAFLLIGIGLGFFIALLLSTYTDMNSDVIYPATIITMSGVGLLVGFHRAKDLDKE